MDKNKLTRSGIRWTLLVVIAFGLFLGALELAEREAQEDAVAATSEPAKVEHLGETGLSRLTLTQSAAKRVGLKTVVVRSRGSQVRVPYAAVLYDETGQAWVYTRPKRLTFVRAPVKIAAIRGEHALLAAGPPAGTIVATVGAAELLGTEFEVDH